MYMLEYIWRRKLKRKMNEKAKNNAKRLIHDNHKCMWCKCVVDCGCERGGCVTKPHARSLLLLQNTFHQINNQFCDKANKYSQSNATKLYILNSRYHVCTYVCSTTYYLITDFQYVFSISLSFAKKKNEKLYIKRQSIVVEILTNEKDLQQLSYVNNSSRFSAPSFLRISLQIVCQNEWERTVYWRWRISVRNCIVLR